MATPESRQPDRTGIPMVAAPQPLTGPQVQARRIRANLLSTVVANGLALLTGPILARGLGPASRGILAAALLWPSFVTLAVELGVPDAVNYFTARGDVSVAAVIRRARLLFIPQAIAIWLTGAPVVYLAMRHLGMAAVVSSLLVLVISPIQFYGYLGANFLNGMHRYGWFNTVLIQSFLVTALAYLVLFLVGDLTVRTAVIANNFSNISVCVVTWIVVRRTLRPVPKLTEANMARRLLAYGIRSWITSVPHMLNDRVDQLVLTVLIAPHELGWYVIAATIATAPSFVGTAVSNSVLPTVAAQRSVRQQAEAARRSIVLTFGLTFSAAVIVALLARPLIEVVFGPSFLGATLSARILALAVVMQAETRVFHGLLRGLGAPLDAAKSEAGALVITAAGLGTLVPLLGITGAALTSVAAYTASTLIAAYLASVRLGIRPQELVLPSRPHS